MATAIVKKIGVGLLTAGLTLAIGEVRPCGARERQNTAHANTEEPGGSVLEREIRHQLQVLPFYSVFDNLQFTLSGHRVVLTGQVVRPTLKAQAEADIKSLEGVGTVENRIEVLPVSGTDDDLRTAIYRAVFEDSTLKRYAAQEVPEIHIVVKNGGVSLEGAVDSEQDKAQARTRACTVANVTEVKNNLTVRAKKGAAQ